jgi:hypothetical protein
MTKPRQCSNCSQPTWRGPYDLCKKCRQNPDWKSFKHLPEIRLLIAIGIDPSEYLVGQQTPPGFENSSEAAAIEALKEG